MGISDIALGITTEVEETEDEFIFTTIKSWCEKKTQRIISKKDLENALKMYFVHSSDFQGMTNGEVIQALFPHIEVETEGVITSVKGLDCDKRALDPYRHFWSNWWYAPYKKEGKKICQN